MTNRPPLLARIGLSRPELRAWALYDWALSAVQATIMVAVFPIFYIRVVGADLPGSEATQHIATANSLAWALIIVVSPVLGALADYAAIRKRLLSMFMVVGVMATGGMFFIDRGEVALAYTLFVLSLAGAAGSQVFYEALLPHVAREDEVDRVSTAGYALGYLGGGLLLALNLAWILDPGLIGLPSGEGLSPRQQTLPTRLALASVAVWWVLFSIPLFRRVPEPPRRIEADEAANANPVRAAVGRLFATLRELREYRQAFLMLLAFLVYNEGLQTIIKMATAYGTELGIGQNALILAILLVQFVGVPFAFLFGALAGRLGTRPAIYLGLAVYVVISVLGYFMSSARDFFLLAGLVGMVQGGTQALSRSLFASMVPPHKSGEFFGFFSVFERFAGVLGPLTFFVVIEVTGTTRNAVLAVIAFFLVGGFLLGRVDIEEGRRAARAAEREATGFLDAQRTAAS
jgi:UMF1 family MFS transporter